MQVVAFIAAFPFTSTFPTNNDGTVTLTYAYDGVQHTINLPEITIPNFDHLRVFCMFVDTPFHARMYHIGVADPTAIIPLVLQITPLESQEDGWIPAFVTNYLSRQHGRRYDDDYETMCFGPIPHYFGVLTIPE